VKLYVERNAPKLKPSTRVGYSDLLESKWFDGWDDLDIAVLSQDEAKLVTRDGELRKHLGSGEALPSAASPSCSCHPAPAN
jgi:hypothetical protein